MITRRTADFFRRHCERLAFAIRAFHGRRIETRVNRCADRRLFIDQFGNRFWHVPGDPIAFNYGRRSVTDALSIIRYIRRNIRRGSVCVDIGANLGGVSVAMWKQVGPDGRVISIEPDPINIDRLRDNLSLNGFSGSEVLPVAIADRRGRAELRRFGKHNGWQTLSSGSRFTQGESVESVVVPTCTFGEVATRFNLQTCDLVKLDVEGAEPIVLQGMLPWLRERRINSVIFEVNEPVLEPFGFSTSDLFDVWNDLPYKLFRLEHGGRTSPLTGVWPSSEFGDCLAVLKVRSEEVGRETV